MFQLASLCCRYANLFLKAVSEKEAPGYRDVVYRPTDLTTIKANLENGVGSWLHAVVECVRARGVSVWPFCVAADSENDRGLPA